VTGEHSIADLASVDNIVTWGLECFSNRGTARCDQPTLTIRNFFCDWDIESPVTLSNQHGGEVHPIAKFLWSRRDRNEFAEIGAERLPWWVEGIARAVNFRRKFTDEWFVDVSFADLQTDPVNTVARSYARLGLTFSDAAHTYDLADCGLTPGHVRKAFSEYPGRYDASA